MFTRSHFLDNMDLFRNEMYYFLESSKKITFLKFGRNVTHFGIGKANRMLWLKCF